MPVVYNRALEQEYEDLYKTCVIHPWAKKTGATIIKRIKAGLGSYQDVELATGVPWWFVAVIHNMECSGNFKQHLHNGDPLTARTVQVPRGRPKDGNPPFEWEESAIDALMLKKLDQWDDWTVGGVLFKLEEYNGFGYRLKHPEVKSPYLWSGCQHYVKGKYVDDGQWSADAVSKQIGVAILLKLMDGTEFTLQYDS